MYDIATIHILYCTLHCKLGVFFLNLYCTYSAVFGLSGEFSSESGDETQTLQLPREMSKLNSRNEHLRGKPLQPFQPKGQKSEKR